MLPLNCMMKLRQFSYGLPTLKQLINLVIFADQIGIVLYTSFKRALPLFKKVAIRMLESQSDMPT